MIYKESFKWQKDNPKVKDLTPDKAIKHALFQTIFNSDRCTNEQVNPNWDNASTNYNGAQDAKINSAFSIRYTKGAHTKTSSVILVDKVEPFIYYK
jgi:catalase (peroxidase I)